jgi:hypothetical protein
LVLLDEVHDLLQKLLVQAVLSDKALGNSSGIITVVERNFESRLPFTHGHVHNTVVHLRKMLQ